MIQAEYGNDQGVNFMWKVSGVYFFRKASASK